MRIEEPKTPFSYQGEDSGDEEGRDLDSKLLAEKYFDIFSKWFKRIFYFSCYSLLKHLEVLGDF